MKSHWKPLFLNAQSLTPKEARYSIQQKIQKINQTSIAYSTILTLAKVNDSDEGLYMCKSLSPKTIQMTYQVRVIRMLKNEFFLNFFLACRKSGNDSKTIDYSNN